MPKYATQWLDYRLDSGHEFSVAVCGYAGNVRHLYIGNDPIRRSFVRHVHVGEEGCSQGAHCLALDCPHNRAEAEHLLHMLDMNEDEPLDSETAAQWGTESTLQSFLALARRISAQLPDALRHGCPPEAAEHTPAR